VPLIAVSAISIYRALADPSGSTWRRDGFLVGPVTPQEMSPRDAAGDEPWEHFDQLFDSLPLPMWEVDASVLRSPRMNPVRIGREREL